MSFKVFLLVVLIGILGTFIYLKAQVLGDQHSSFNQTTRYSLGRYPSVRQLLGMHQDGDARGEYLVGANPIAIEIVQAVNLPLPDAVIKKFTDQVHNMTGRPVVLFNIDTIPNGTLSDVDVKNIVSTKRRHLDVGQPNFFIVYAQDFTGQPNEVGHTLQEFGMIMSDQRLIELTKYYPAALPDYQLSTMLHEFGHQVGLDHNDKESCIMNPEVESPSAVLPFSGSVTPTSFCSFESDQVQAIKASLQ